MISFEYCINTVHSITHVNDAVDAKKNQIDFISVSIAVNWIVLFTISL